MQLMMRRHANQNGAAVRGCFLTAEFSEWRRWSGARIRRSRCDTARLPTGGV